MRIGVCTLTIGEDFKHGSSICVKSIVDYCTRYGYEFINDESITKEGREPYWNKVLLLEKYLNQFDFLVWIDADMLIMNPEIKLERFIVRYLCQKDMLLAIDCGDQINTGFWIVRNCAWSKTILHMIYNLPELCGDYHEQGVLNQLYKKNVIKCQDRCEILPEIESRLVNATMSTYHYGDFLIHFLGIRRPHILHHVSQQFAPFALNEEKQDIVEKRLEKIRRDYAEGVANPRYIVSQPRVKLAFVSLLIGDKYTWGTEINYGLRSLQEYSRKKGYTVIVETESLDPTLPPHFSKMLMINKHLAEYDYVVWIDADIMIMNHKIDFIQFIEDNMGMNDMMLSRDISGHINTGMWVVKNSAYSRDILDATYRLTELRDRQYEDQDVFNQIYNRNLMNAQQRIKIFPVDEQDKMNCCVGLYKWETFLIHFMSLSKEGLRSAFRDFYPDRRDDEHQLQFQHRIQYLINYNK